MSPSRTTTGTVTTTTTGTTTAATALTAAQLVADQNKRKIQHGQSDVLTLIFEKNADPALSNSAGVLSTAAGSTLTVLP